MTEEIIAKLRQENAKLYGRLGAQGLALKKEKEIKALQAEIDSLHKQIEEQNSEQNKLKNDLIAAALQGLLANPNIISYGVMTAIAEEQGGSGFIVHCSYNIAQALSDHIKAKNQTLD